jgi:Tfp pilus assembly protein PilO
MELIKSIDKHKNRILSLAIIIFAVIVAFNFIYQNKMRQMQALKEKVDTESKKNAVLENISQLEQRINVYKGYLAKKDATSVMSIISNIAAEATVKIVSIKPGKEVVNPEYTKLPFELSVSAKDYHTLGRFISGLENYETVFVVENINIATGSDKKELDVSLVVSSITYTE